MYATVKKTQIVEMSIAKTDCKQTLKQLVTAQKKVHPDCGFYAINGGLYDMDTGRVNAIPLRINGKTIATSPNGYWMMAWNTGPDVCMIHSRDMEKWKYAVACSAFLKDGTNTIFTYTKAQDGYRGRTGFGDDDTRVHLLATLDGRENLWPSGLRSKMKAGGCKNGIMLDCGGSSQGYFNGTYVYTGRPVAYWICVWVKNSSAPTALPNAPSGVLTKTVNTNSGPLRVRSAAKLVDKPSNVIGYLAKGTKVTVLAVSGAWSKVSGKSTTGKAVTGWVSGAYLK